MPDARAAEREAHAMTTAPTAATSPKTANAVVIERAATGSPFRVQLSRRKGWKMPANTVDVSRPTAWGNPFIVGKHGTRERCVELFRLLCGGYHCISLGRDVCDAQKAFVAHAKANRETLRGKNLACWCPLNKPCHADVLREMANVKLTP